MANKRKLQVGSIQAHKLIAELLEKREIIKTQVQFRKILESQKRGNYQNESNRLQGAKRLTALQPDVKSRMKELQQKYIQLKARHMHKKTKNTFRRNIWKANTCKII